MGNGAEPGMGTPESSTERSPVGETEFNTLEQGVIKRARRAGFGIELNRGRGPSGGSTRASGLRAAPVGLTHFSIIRIGDKAQVWIKFHAWPARRSTMAELRAELDLMIDQGSRHLDGDLPHR